MKAFVQVNGQQALIEVEGLAFYRYNSDIYQDGFSRLIVAQTFVFESLTEVMETLPVQWVEAISDALNNLARLATEDRDAIEHSRRQDKLAYLSR